MLTLCGNENIKEVGHHIAAVTPKGTWGLCVLIQHAGIDGGIVSATQGFLVAQRIYENRGIPSLSALDQKDVAFLL